ncbi:hypothetical protein [Acidipila sp. EB88]|uniref:hypothetical protein n=1 Tax=Acidipila sp. EB88 TaxID=2305226 RepID=UPI000F5DE50A|nr:hypothetical protein [Acidipila sp. EB88]RRA49507.1 hypothetical protein D1Y84_15745 [Acidipila sp. EB88]
MIRASNEVGDFWHTQGGMETASARNERVIKLGDQTEEDRAAQNAAPAPPTLRKPGESLPADKSSQQPSMQPVQFPTQKPNTTPSQ